MSALSNEEILQLSFQELRSKCKKAHLSGAGGAEALRNRLQNWLVNQGEVDNEDRGVKRGNKAYDKDEGAPIKHPKKSPADDLICPITLELPWDPVSADDGRIYEKDAIEKHIETQRKKKAVLKSPITNEPMRKRLVHLRQHKSLIETLIENGSIKGELASNWNKRVEQAKRMEDLQQKANTGDIYAIYKLGNNYRHGLEGFKENVELAFQWYQKGHDRGCCKSTALLGDAFFRGRGALMCKQRGLMYTTMAAAQGSDFAAFKLGSCLANGHGVPQDKKEAIRWLKKCLSHDYPVRHMAEETEDRAKTLLEELLNENVAGVVKP